MIGVSQVINKNGEGYFSNNDEKVFEKYLQFCGIGLRNAQLYERSQLEVKRNQVLLDIHDLIHPVLACLSLRLVLPLLMPNLPRCCLTWPVSSSRSRARWS